MNPRRERNHLRDAIEGETENHHARTDHGIVNANHTTHTTPQKIRELRTTNKSTIVRVSVVLRKTVWDDIDWRFDNLSGSHLQSQVTCVTSVDTIRTPVVDVIGQLIRDVIGRLSVEPWCDQLTNWSPDSWSTDSCDVSTDSVMCQLTVDWLTVVLHLTMILLLGSNHLQQPRGKLQAKWRKIFLDVSQPVRTRYIQILGFESHRNDTYGNSPLKRKWTMNMKKPKKTNPNKTGQIKKILDRRVVNLFSFLQHNLWFHSSDKMTK